LCVKREHVNIPRVNGYKYGGCESLQACTWTESVLVKLCTETGH